MRYIYAKFCNYIGFLNGMGLEEIEIDFSKCRNSIVLIRGINGSGKSTLLSSLNIFPDPSTSYVPGKDASKLLSLISGNDRYDIQIISTADVNGGRKTTKAFIQKNGSELNSNGNVTSYKDIVFSEFELDSNYISLTHLSSDNKGLGSLRPAERKRFASNIIENLEVYNSMYKTLNKESSIYKSYVNNLHTKIQNIGARDNIENTLISLRNKEHETSKKIMELNNLIVSIQAKSSIDETEAKKINELNSKLAALDNQISSIQSSINICINKTNINESDIENIVKEHTEVLNKYELNTEKYKLEWKSLSEKLISTSESINNIEAELSSYNIDESISEQYTASKNKLNDIKNEVLSFGYEPDSNLILPLSGLIDYFKTLCTDIDSLYNDCTSDDLKFIALNYNPNIVNDIMNKSDEVYLLIQDKEKELCELREKLKIYSVLESRPKKCNIDSCPFISEAVLISKEYGGNKLVDNIGKLQNEIFDLSNQANDLSNKLEIAKNRVLKRAVLDRILSSINRNIDKIKLFNIIELSDINVFLKLISEQNNFNNIRDYQKWSDLLNTLQLYSAEQNVYDKLFIQYKANQDSIRIINSNKSMLIKLKQEQEDLSSKVIDAKNNYNKFDELRISYSNNLVTEKEYLELYNKITDLNKEKSSVQETLDEYNKKSSKALEELSNIHNYRAEIDRLTSEDKPISDEISRLSGQLTMLDSYYNEYNQCKQKYDMIETLKKYCSPTAGGIQVLFMQLYMSKTLDMSNQILSMLFNGEYRLLDFVINQNEFRIPFIGNGMPVDDISNGSSSQVSMMSMIINLVLLYQASSKFNIASLDEIDGPLDSYNRSGFVNVLYRVMPLLNIEQLFIISHSIELDSSAADVIKLKSYNDYESSGMGNIIWDYDEIIKN